jgi:hypothetical protein
MRTALLVCLLALSIPCAAQGPSEEDKTKIKQTALDYIEGWYTKDAVRMERALHPELAKRMVSTVPNTGRSALNQMSAMTLVQGTRNKPSADPATARREVTILDGFKNAVCVRVDAERWVDFLQMAKWNGEWKIVNVLWEMR